MIPGQRITVDGVFPRERPCYLCAKPGVQMAPMETPVCGLCKRTHLSENQPN